MELKQLVEDLSQALYDEMCQGCEDDESFSASVITPSGQIEAYYFISNGNYWELEIYVYHDNTDTDHNDTNLEEYLANNIDIDWESVKECWRNYNMDEYQRNGFASEADFWHWKEGR